MLIGLKGNNYYAKVFKRVNYKLSNSPFWVVIMLIVIKSHIGIALLETPHGNLRVNDVLVVPNLKKKFFSRR